MILGQSKTANINYLSKIVYITEFTQHLNPEVTALKCAHVDGYTIIVGIDEKPGLFVYFPTSSCINPNLLMFANLYAHTEKNANPEAKKGYFKDNGRVTAIKLKGQVSEGFLLPADIFNSFLLSTVNKSIKLEDYINVEFDCVQEGNKEFWISKKYVIIHKISSTSNNKISKKLRGTDKVIDTQFRFHYNTVLIRKVPYAISPDDIIHISSKIHGTSHISAYVLCHKDLNWKEKIAKWLTKDPFDQYDYLYSSRSVIKDRYYNPKVAAGYYSEDVWKYAHEYLKPFLTKGMTMYAEIVGFLPNGNYIQKGFDYGCVPPNFGEAYTAEKHYKVRVYRITLTNVDGVIHEFSPREVQCYCLSHNLIPVKEFYYGKAKDLYPDLNPEQHWAENFIERLANDPRFYMEQKSPECNNNVPQEGIVIKVDNMLSQAFKLKTFAFLNKEQKELDAGESNIEDES